MRDYSPKKQEETPQREIPQQDRKASYQSPTLVTWLPCPFLEIITRAPLIKQGFERQYQEKNN